MPFPPCPYCGSNGPCTEGCNCSKCADPESYARFKADPVRYYRYIENQRKLAKQQQDLTRAVRRTEQKTRQLNVLKEVLGNPADLRTSLREHFVRIFMEAWDETHAKMPPSQWPELEATWRANWESRIRSELFPDDAIDATLWRVWTGPDALPDILNDISSDLSEVHLPFQESPDHLEAVELMSDFQIDMFITVQRWAVDRLPGMTARQIDIVLRVLQELMPRAR